MISHVSGESSKRMNFHPFFVCAPVQRSAHFVLYACRNQMMHARLGVVVAKRLAPRAATRNMIKRVARESFRQMSMLPVDCILRLAKPVNQKKAPRDDRYAETDVAPGSRQSAAIAMRAGTSTRRASMKLVLILLRGYQLCISPFLGSNCRFYPSCSAYAMQAIELHGVFKGCLLAAKRLCSCHPWHCGGFDPVPHSHSHAGCNGDDRNSSTATPRHPF